MTLLRSYGKVAIDGRTVMVNEVGRDQFLTAGSPNRADLSQHSTLPSRPTLDVATRANVPRLPLRADPLPQQDHRPVVDY